MRICWSRLNCAQRSEDKEECWLIRGTLLHQSKAAAWASSRSWMCTGIDRVHRLSPPHRQYCRRQAVRRGCIAGGEGIAKTEELLPCHRGLWRGDGRRVRDRGHPLGHAECQKGQYVRLLMGRELFHETLDLVQRAFRHLFLHLDFTRTPQRHQTPRRTLPP